jgi:hypothetical protein
MRQKTPASQFERAGKLVGPSTTSWEKLREEPAPDLTERHDHARNPVMKKYFLFLPWRQKRSADGNCKSGSHFGIFC